MPESRSFRFDGPHGRPICADLTLPDSDRMGPVVIFVHGFKGFKDWGAWPRIGERIARAGHPFLRFNFSHNGTTPEQPQAFADPEAFGRNTFSKELDDLGAVIDGVTSGEWAPSLTGRPLALIGHSRGGGIVLLKAGEDDRVTRVITWAGVSEFGRFWDRDTMAKWEREGIHHVINARTGETLPLYWDLYADYAANPDRLHIPSVAARLSVPVLILHGDADPVVPVAMAEELAAIIPDARLVRIPDADHTFAMRHPWTDAALPAPAEAVLRETLAFLNARPTTG